MSRHPRLQWQTFKRLDTHHDGRIDGCPDTDSPTTSKPRAPLCGLANETELVIEGMRVPALLDTGSQITSVSLKFYENYLQHHTLEPINEFLNVNSATGHSIGLKGVVVLDLTVPTCDGNSSLTIPTPTIVVETTPYNSMVPFIVGTNLIKCCENVFDDLHTS